ncbi:MAG: lipoate--protein ligase [Tenuifilaceae bacterium]
MLIILQTSTNPYFNIATEEYLLKNSTDDIFILYRNEPSIIVGKHQNTIAEINLDFVKKKELKVVRRLSGGGTVYHDLGNLNYSFIANGSEGNLVDFKKFTQPIIEVLLELGVEAFLGGKNDIRVGDKKISGNAEHVYKNRVLHHGTLLFSSQLNELDESIKVNLNTYTDKAVKSIRSHVANISEYLKESISIEQFINSIINHIKKNYPDSLIYNLTDQDILAINHLVETKYSTWQWNFGYSPTYTLTKDFNIGKDNIKITIQVDKGIICSVNFETSLLNKNQVEELESLLVGCPHDIDEIRNRMARKPVLLSQNISIDQLIKELF